jgi:hypothetical protein
MAIITFDETEVVEYVPRSERGEKNPTVVGMHRLPFKTVEKYSRMVTEGFGRKQVDVTRVAEQSRSVQRKQFSEGIAWIKNYFVIKGGVKREITTPEEFYDVIDNGLMAELIGAMESTEKLTEGQLKNFVAASGFSSGEGQEK